MCGVQSNWYIGLAFCRGFRVGSERTTHTMFSEKSMSWTRDPHRVPNDNKNIHLQSTPTAEKQSSIQQSSTTYLLKAQEPAKASLDCHPSPIGY
ncbi:hypothetical protein M378DRAFT_167432 [Amanita muscaria Koide BX008]|uniref:Uncharacterized protein n=1 Tax=Amanita muscaria (strain Koide BX008) TaxID=946122 RepID=A0A0C2WHX5_AMAMK|nr:hypothetical protein M378DRAFT_167432 [Amanita muscaria Koide BX008]